MNVNFHTMWGVKGTGEPYTSKCKITQSSLLEWHGNCIFEPCRIINEDVELHYRFVHELGKGTGGITVLCHDKVTNEAYACKTIMKDHKLRNSIDEVHIMNHLRRQFPNGHPNIVKLVRVFEDKEAIHLIMEFCAGGNLGMFIRDHGPLVELDAAVIICGIMRALQACHEVGVMHRDVKPANVMLCGNPKKRNVDVKLIDFGLSTLKCTSTDDVGTFGYIAPEILERKSYSIQVDIWSAGILLLALFLGKCSKKSVEDFLEGRPNDNIQLSDGAKDVLHRMLTRDPRKRMTAGQFFQHPWVKKNESLRAEMERSNSKGMSFLLPLTEVVRKTAKSTLHTVSSIIRTSKTFMSKLAPELITSKNFRK